MWRHYFYEISNLMNRAIFTGAPIEEEVLDCGYMVVSSTSSNYCIINSGKGYAPSIPNWLQYGFLLFSQIKELKLCTAQTQLNFETKPDF